MKIVLYTRVVGGAEFPDTDVQERRCREWAEIKGHEVVKVVRTASYGPLDQGPYRALRAEIYSGRYEAVVAATLSRYGRQTAKLREIQLDASAAGVRLFTVDPDQEITDPLVTVLGIVGEAYRERWGREQLARETRDRQKNRRWRRR